MERKKSTVILIILMGLMIMTPTAISTSVITEQAESISIQVTTKPNPLPVPQTVIHVPDDYPTIQDAVDAASDGNKIIVSSGEWYGAIVTKAVEIKGEGGATIVDGPAHGSGMHIGFKLGYGLGGSGAEISHFTFECVLPWENPTGLTLAIMSNNANDVTVHHCKFYNALQGITNWNGNGWYIHHNKFYGLTSRNGGAIGIFCGSYTGVTVDNNVIINNKISGTLQVYPNDGGGYDGTGICLYADFRWGSAGASEITGNLILHNDIDMISDTPGVVDFNAIELTDSRNDLNQIIIFDNSIRFNDMRGSANGILLTPSNLGDYNLIKNNKF
jgi:hypothetical protein